jgi:aspartyl-tRNA(Asn)/glutamyl-tRNA(Gln) amidotransferase subunit B
MRNGYPVPNIIKHAVNWILGPIREYLNETGKTYPSLFESIPQLNELLDLVETNQLSFSNATGKVFKGIIGTNKKAIQFAEEHQFSTKQFYRSN